MAWQQFIMLANKPWFGVKAVYCVKAMCVVWGDTQWRAPWNACTQLRTHNSNFPLALLSISTFFFYSWVSASHQKLCVTFSPLRMNHLRSDLSNTGNFVHTIPIVSAMTETSHLIPRDILPANVKSPLCWLQWKQMGEMVCAALTETSVRVYIDWGVQTLKNITTMTHPTLKLSFLANCFKGLIILIRNSLQMGAPVAIYGHCI